MKMMINKISIIGFLSVLLFSTWSCKDWLDIRPEGQTVLEDYWTSESDVEAVLMSCYRSLTTGPSMERLMMWGELRSDNVVMGFTLPIDIFRVLNVDITTSNGLCEWGTQYTTINYCNTLLRFAPQVLNEDVNFTVSELNARSAEALTIRAFCYFNLIRTFGRVPYVTTPSVDDTQDYSVKQSDETVILDSMVMDLKRALIFAPDSYTNTKFQKGRITKNAVRALLADVYLWRQEYTPCIEMCNQIIDDKTLQLVDADVLLQQVFYKGNSSESIFELQFDQDEITNIGVFGYYGYANNKQGALMYPQYLLLSDDEKSRDSSPFGYEVSSKERESSNDIRLKTFVYENENSGFNHIFKYAGESVNIETDKHEWTTKSPNWIVYRLPDVILMKAEALVQRNGGSDLVEALKMVNTTYLRSNPSLGNDSLKISNYDGQSAFEKLVLRERQRELMFEGKRWYDLLRLARRANSTKPLLSYVTIKYGSSDGLQENKLSLMDALYLPIHQSEMDANSNLEQNDFYKLDSSSSSSSN